MGLLFSFTRPPTTLSRALSFSYVSLSLFLFVYVCVCKPFISLCSILNLLVFTRLEISFENLCDPENNLHVWL